LSAFYALVGALFWKISFDLQLSASDLPLRQLSRGLILARSGLPLVITDFAFAKPKTGPTTRCSQELNTISDHLREFAFCQTRAC
jgi:hypothetical protein